MSYLSESYNQFVNLLKTSHAHLARYAMLKGNRETFSLIMISQPQLIAKHVVKVTAVILLSQD